MDGRWHLIVLAAMALSLPWLGLVGAQDGPQATVAFQDQTTSGTVLLVDAVQFSHGGFVVVHAEPTHGSPLGPVIGRSGSLGAGFHTDVPVTLQAPLDRAQHLQAVPHLDRDQNAVFDPSRDPPYQHNGSPVVDVAYVQPAGTEAGAGPPWTEASLAGATLALASIGYILWQRANRA